MNEICFNLWYYLANDQTVLALAARHYFLGGTETEKESILEALSYHDFRLVAHEPLPRSLITKTGERIHYSAIRHFGIEEVYSELFRKIQSQIPSGVPFPNDKLFFATPLYDFGKGFVPAEIGNEFVRSK